MHLAMMLFPRLVPNLANQSAKIEGHPLEEVAARAILRKYTASLILFWCPIDPNRPMANCAGKEIAKGASEPRKIRLTSTLLLQASGAKFGLAMIWQQPDGRFRHLRTHPRLRNGTARRRNPPTPSADKRMGAFSAPLYFRRRYLRRAARLWQSCRAV